MVYCTVVLVQFCEIIWLMLNRQNIVGLGLSWFPSEIKYLYVYCHSCTKAIFIVFIHRWYILLNYATVSISFQKLNCSTTEPWFKMVYHRLLGENVCSNVVIRIKHDLLIFYYLCLTPNKIRWYLSLRLAPDNKNYDKYSCDHGWHCTVVKSYSENMVRHHCLNTVNHGQTWLTMKNNGTIVILTSGTIQKHSTSSESLNIIQQATQTRLTCEFHNI